MQHNLRSVLVHATKVAALVSLIFTVVVYGLVRLIFYELEFAFLTELTWLAKMFVPAFITLFTLTTLVLLVAKLRIKTSVPKLSWPVIRFKKLALQAS